MHFRIGFNFVTYCTLCHSYRGRQLRHSTAKGVCECACGSESDTDKVQVPARRSVKAIGGRKEQAEQHGYNWPILCCIFSFTVWYAFIMVCSLIMISVVSGLGRLTRDAIAVASVSTIILKGDTKFQQTFVKSLWGVSITEAARTRHQSFRQGKATRDPSSPALPASPVGSSAAFAERP